MALSPDRAKVLLAEIESQLVSAMHAYLPLGGAPPCAVTVGSEGGQESIGLVPILDVRDRHLTLKRAVQASGADGVVFVYDGFIQSADKVKVDAVLVVVASRWGTEAYATPYRRENGRVTVLRRLPAPEGVAEAYADLFAA
jgi:hypothetical protein